jgi:predicted metalloprotease with PDZ domain
VRSASNAAIEKGIAEPVIGELPYWRGSLYAAELDAAIRLASQNKRSLDDFMRELRPRAKDASQTSSRLPEVSEAQFRELVFAELGQTGADRFDAVIRRGEIPRPLSFAYGPCFERKDLRYGEYELGFDKSASWKEPKMVRRLIAGSAPEKAGIAEGDLILEWEPAPADPTKEVVMTVKKKNGKTAKVRFLPARPGTSVEAYEWVRRKEVPDEQCKKARSETGGGKL